MDIYTKQQIVKDGVIPEEFIFASPGFLPQCQGIVPSKNIFAHIAGIDLVKGKDGIWYVLEDNLRVPSGASYPMIARASAEKQVLQHSVKQRWRITEIMENYFVK